MVSGLISYNYPLALVPSAPSRPFTTGSKMQVSVKKVVVI